MSVLECLVPALNHIIVLVLQYPLHGVAVEMFKVVWILHISLFVYAVRYLQSALCSFLIVHDLMMFYPHEINIQKWTLWDFI